MQTSTGSTVLHTCLLHSRTHALLCVLRWRAKVILLRIPVRDRPEVQLKAVAFGALEQRRPNWGYNRKWSGSYLNMSVSGVGVGVSSVCGCEYE